MSAQRERLSYSGSQDLVPLPNLLEAQHKSFQWFIEEGLGELFQEINPVEDYTGTKLSLTFKDYYFDEPKMSEWEAKENNVSYDSSLYVTVELVNKVTGEVKEQEIYLGDYPMMTERATFIINGAERAVVSQIIRSPGVFFTADAGSDRSRYGAKVIPGRGAWLEFETAANGEINVKIDRRKKLPATTLLRAMGLSSNQDIQQVLTREADADVDHIQATLDKDPSQNTSEALIEVYRRLRPGDLATVENAKALIDSTFFEFKRFDLSKVGRYKINRRLGLETPDDTDHRVMQVDDVIAIINEIVRLNKTQEPEDEIDSFANRRLRMVGELIQHYFRIGLLRMDRNMKDRMSVYDLEEVTAQQLLNARPVVASVREFFASSQLSQFMEQVNPLAELTHKRRLSATGPGGLSRERAGFEVRDMHRTHYGRVCMVETSEGANVGLVLSLTIYARINEYGFVETPYRKVMREVAASEAKGYIAREDIVDESGKTLVSADTEITAAHVKKFDNAGINTVPIKPIATNEVVYLDSQDEDNTVIADASNALDENGYFVEDRVSVRRGGRPGEEETDHITHMDISPQQAIGVTAGLIPFIEQDDVTRAVMGSNQSRQAVPLLRPQAPIVGTGMEGPAAYNSRQMITAQEAGTVTKATAKEVVVDYKSQGEVTHPLHIFTRSNDGTAITNQVAVNSGQKVQPGDLLADGMSTEHGELAIGANLLVGFMPWEGYNFEDAIVISRRLVEDDTLTSVHIEEFSLEVRETKLGPEQVTRDIPNVSEDALANLDETGVVRIGAEVKPGDILVGKITPKGEQELSSEERLLRAVFGEKAKDVRDSSRRMPGGKHGKVVGVKVFTRESGHELKAGILQNVHVYVAQTRKIAVGDKLGARHGNKGVIARVLPQEDMPFMEDGTPMDILLNPLGVAQRMNIGQIFETHLGWAASALGYNVAVPPFEKVSTDHIKQELKKAGLPEDGKTQLYDGRTGESFKEPTTVGYIYINKLKHMIDDKIHARSTGPYPMVTQQPLGGKAQNGGQRFGEMEVWALEAYGVAHTLQEMLTIKSDDVIGRSKAYESIIKSDDIHGPRLPESFNVLVKELQSLNLDVDLVKSEEVVGAEEVLEEKYESDLEETGVVKDDPGPTVDVTEDADEDDFALEEAEPSTRGAADSQEKESVSIGEEEGKE
ncbi:DNA-directed RNA polymerase subunit beta [Candidatus Saccharibacteria bacterium SW_7_54_9]|nr:MAG: DNA-directed RNA polymerase subunit beta [Candidatus Saccharibacteria bacterium SW_7_54_9]